MEARIDELTASIDHIKTTAASEGRELTEAEREQITDYIVERAAVHRELHRAKESGTRALVHDMGKTYRQSHALREMKAGGLIFGLGVGLTFFTMFFTVGGFGW